MHKVYDTTNEYYIKLLESIRDQQENRIHGQFIQVNKDLICDVGSLNVEESKIFSIIPNLKVRFENYDNSTKVYISISRQGNAGDKENLLLAGDICELNKKQSTSK